jgi:hypothetical protein
MLTKLTGLTVIAALLWSAAGKKPPTGSAQNNAIAITSRLYNGRDAVRQILGIDVKADIVVVEVEITPKLRRTLRIDPDDFLLRSDKDGQKCPALAPSQIAGPALRVTTLAGGEGSIMGDRNGPVWGGVGGPPRRLPGDGGVLGNTPSDATQTGVGEVSQKTEDSLLATLKAKALSAKETGNITTGLLYFLMEGKHKTKDLELQYTSPEGKLSTRFQDQPK